MGGTWLVRGAANDWGGDALAKRLRVFRPAQDGSGTTILVVAFFEPEQEELREPCSIAKDILASAARWFWPSFRAGLLQVKAEVYSDETLIFSDVAKETPEVLPFYQAVSAGTQDMRQHLAEPGEVAERTISVLIPEKRSETGVTATGKIRAEALLRVRAAGNGDSPSLQNRVALVRGSGMVVDYRECRAGSDALAYHAVLLAGLAKGSDPADEALEEFLRAAEPPGHDNWTYPTDRLRAEYARGSRTALLQLWQEIQRAIRQVCAEAIPESSVGPEGLARLFPLGPRSVQPPGGGLIRVVSQTASFQDGVWTLEVKIRRSRADAAQDWGFAVRAWLDVESGEGEPVSLTRASVDGEVATQSGPWWVCKVPAQKREVTFWAETEPPSSDWQEKADLLRRTRLRLDIRPRACTD